MSNAVSIRDVAKEAEVSAAAVSYTLNGKGDRYRIGRDTQQRIRAVAVRLGYQPNSLARNIRLGNWHPADSAPQSPAIRREVGLVVGTVSSASSLSMIPGQELILAAAGFTTVIIALPADGEDARRRLAELGAAGFFGILCCPSLFTAVASAMANQCPLIALSPWAAETLLGKHPVAATRTDTPIPPADTVQPAPTTKPIPVITPVVVATPTPVVVSKPPPIMVPTPTPVADPTPTPEPVPVVVPEPAATPTTEVPPPAVEPAPLASKVDADVSAALESSESPSGTYAAETSASTLTAEPAVVEVEAPPVVIPEPVAEVPPPVMVPEPTTVADPTPTPEPVPVVVPEPAATPTTEVPPPAVANC